MVLKVLVSGDHVRRPTRRRTVLRGLVWCNIEQDVLGVRALGKRGIGYVPHSYTSATAYLYTLFIGSLFYAAM